MALNATKIRKAVQDAIVNLGELSSSITYVQVAPGAYDPATDAVTTTETTHTAVACALVRTTEQDIDWAPANILTQKALIPYLNLPIVPKEDDYVLIDGERWDVHKIKTLPGSPVHILFLRET